MTMSVKKAKNLAEFLQDLDKLYGCGFYSRLNDEATKRLAAFPAVLASIKFQIEFIFYLTKYFFRL